MLKDLIEGFREFRRTNFKQQRGLFRTLAWAGQKPKAALITCCDSRVDPTLIFAAQPGDIFVVRNVANLVPPYTPNKDYHGTSAALEFAVRELGVQLLVVMGHTQCGGVAALPKDRSDQNSDFVDHWMSIAEPALAKLRAGLPAGTDPDLPELERAVVRLSLDNLRTFPWIAEAEKAGKLLLCGMLFDVADAELHVLDNATGQFQPVSPPRPRFHSALSATTTAAVSGRPEDGAAHT
ncbi:carbonic anhydrase [Niveispirillum sp.]|uniref:carbonic anhydrase n=1 Tax=Niveispirillum sp. TaxID=1917217 RepID=UPI0025EE11D7|nr:carbonic anhydrase [Niveispirillum sp.]